MGGNLTGQEACEQPCAVRAERKPRRCLANSAELCERVATIMIVLLGELVDYAAFRRGGCDDVEPPVADCRPWRVLLGPDNATSRNAESPKKPATAAAADNPKIKTTDMQCPPSTTCFEQHEP